MWPWPPTRLVVVFRSFLVFYWQYSHWVLCCLKSFTFVGDSYLVTEWSLRAHTKSSQMNFSVVSPQTWSGRIGAYSCLF
jgi:hypothetical protein